MQIRHLLFECLHFQMRQ